MDNFFCTYCGSPSCKLPDGRIREVVCISLTLPRLLPELPRQFTLWYLSARRRFGESNSHTKRMLRLQSTHLKGRMAERGYRGEIDWGVEREKNVALLDGWRHGVGRCCSGGFTV